MLSHCLKCEHKKHSKNPSVAKTNKEKLIMLSKCALRDTKNYLSKSKKLVGYSVA